MVTDLSTPESAARNFAWIATAGTLFQILTPALTGLLYTGGLPIQFLDNKFVQALPPAALACNVYAILIVVSCGALARNLPGVSSTLKILSRVFLHLLLFIALKPYLDRPCPTRTRESF